MCLQAALVFPVPVVLLTPDILKLLALTVINVSLASSTHRVSV